MDPNAALEELRSAMAELADTTFDHIQDKFSDLDGWLSRGGFLPNDWGTRPPFEQNSDGSWSYTGEE